jgi:hypothetical protein
MERNGVESFVPKENCVLHTLKVNTTIVPFGDEKAEIRKGSKYFVGTFKVIPIGLSWRIIEEDSYESVWKEMAESHQRIYSGSTLHQKLIGRMVFAPQQMMTELDRRWQSTFMIAQWTSRKWNAACCMPLI